MGGQLPLPSSGIDGAACLTVFGGGESYVKTPKPRSEALPALSSARVQRRDRFGGVIREYCRPAQQHFCTFQGAKLGLLCLHNQWVLDDASRHTVLRARGAGVLLDQSKGARDAVRCHRALAVSPGP